MPHNYIQWLWYWFYTIGSAIGWIVLLKCAYNLFREYKGLITWRIKLVRVPTGQS